MSHFYRFPYTENSPVSPLTALTWFTTDIERVGIRRGSDQPVQLHDETRFKCLVISNVLDSTMEEKTTHFVSLCVSH